MIVTSETLPVSVNNNSAGILQIKGLEKYNYLRKAPENKIISSSLKMSKIPVMKFSGLPNGSSRMMLKRFCRFPEACFVFTKFLSLR